LDHSYTAVKATKMQAPPMQAAAWGMLWLGGGGLQEES
jgi:hypothetical protein